MSDHYDRYNGMEELLGTDAISRRSAIDVIEQGFKDATNGLDKFSPTCGLIKAVTGIYKCYIEQLPPIQPDNGLQKLADEIASFKRCVKSENSDYLTGYLCALSVVEGMIADMREVTT